MAEVVRRQSPVGSGCGGVDAGFYGEARFSGARGRWRRQRRHGRRWILESGGGRDAHTESEALGLGGWPLSRAAAEAAWTLPELGGVGQWQGSKGGRRRRLKGWKKKSGASVMASPI